MGQCVTKDRRRLQPASEQEHARQRESANRRRPDPQRRSEPQHQPASRRELAIGGDSGSQRGSTSRPNPLPSPTVIPMTPRLRYEYMRELYNGLEGLEYAIIGGAAIVEYGRDRGTSDIDVIVPVGIRNKAIEQLLQRDVSIVRTANGRLG